MAYAITKKREDPERLDLCGVSTFHLSGGTNYSRSVRLTKKHGLTMPTAVGAISYLINEKSLMEYLLGKYPHGFSFYVTDRTKDLMSLVSSGQNGALCQFDINTEKLKLGKTENPDHNVELLITNMLRLSNFPLAVCVRPDVVTNKLSRRFVIHGDLSPFYLREMVMTLQHDTNLRVQSKHGLKFISEIFPLLRKSKPTIEKSIRNF